MTDYLVFGRQAYDQPLALLGPIRVEGELPEARPRLIEQTRQQFGEAGWIEMIAIPSSAAIRVIPVSGA